MKQPQSALPFVAGRDAARGRSLGGVSADWILCRSVQFQSALTEET